MKDLHQALFNLSLELPALPKDGLNPHFKSRYTKYDTIMEKIGPLLEKHELLWLSGPSFDTNGNPTLTWSLVHVPSDQAVSGKMLLMVDKSNPQGQGSALTYARRYCITTVLNLIADEDDDGNAASPAPKATPKTALTFKEKLKKTGVDANAIRMYLSGKDMPLAPDENLGDFLNDLAPKAQAEASEVGTGMSNRKFHALVWRNYQRGYAETAGKLLSGDVVDAPCEDDVDASPSYHSGVQRAIDRKPLPNQLPLDVWVRALASRQRP